MPERVLAQARLVRLDEEISRSGDPSSPRRDLAQQSEAIPLHSRLGESHSPRQNYQVFHTVLHMQSYEIHTTIQLRIISSSNMKLS